METNTDTTRILIVIPARYGASRFPGKPLADIAGKPMIQWVWEGCMRSALATDVVVATDDERISSVVESFGGTAYMTDPDLPSGTERMAAVAAGIEADIYVNVQGDEPLIASDTIDASVRPLLDDPSIDIGTAALPLTSAEEIANPNIVKAVCDSYGRALYFSRSPIPYLRDGIPESGIPDGLFRKHVGIYAFRKAALETFARLAPSPLEQAEKLEQLRALQHGMSIHVATVHSDTVAVDVPGDIARVLEYMERHPVRR